MNEYMIGKTMFFLLAFGAALCTERWGTEEVLTLLLVGAFLYALP
jgi:hypothetical protein